MAISGTILVTRDLSEDQLGLAEKLGLRVVMKPAISIDFRNDWLTVQSAIEKAEHPIFVFTSQNGVKAFDQFLQAGIDFPDHVRMYAVGSKTKDTLQQIGFDIVKTPQEQNGVGLAHLIIDDVLNNPDLKNAEVLHFCGDKRRNELRHFLTESDITIKDIVVYSTKMNQMNLPGNENLDGILFYSPSSVQAFRQSGGFQQGELPELFAIGPTTAEELSIESGKHVHISPKPDTEFFLMFVARLLGNETLRYDL